MAYIVVNEPRYKLGNGIGKNVTMVFAPAILDERTWDVASATVPAAVGEILYPEIFDYTDDTSYEERHFPVEKPVGHEVVGVADGKNLGAYTQRMKLTLEFLDPSGISKGKKYIEYDVAPGKLISCDTKRVILDTQGTWKLHVILEAA